MNVERLKTLCKKRGVTFALVERETGIANGSITRWGRSIPNVLTAKKVADYLGVSLDWMVRDDDA